MMILKKVLAMSVCALFLALPVAALEDNATSTRPADRKETQETRKLEIRQSKVEHAGVIGAALLADRKARR